MKQFSINYSPRKCQSFEGDQLYMLHHERHLT
jgi:hypothetical protein